jgi:alkylated DNA repair protein (DNA oxidative demethylase)
MVSPEERARLWRPVVSVSLGLPATLLFGGHERSERLLGVPLTHADIAVWGGEDRVRFTG